MDYVRKNKPNPGIRGRRILEFKEYANLSSPSAML